MRRARPRTHWTPPTERDAHEDPALIRAGYGNAALHTWWPLTDAEVAALAGLPKAREGDAHALFALAILASDGPRDAASYRALEARVDAFVAHVRPAIDGAADAWHRGYELHRAMHASLFGEAKGALGGYQLSQSRVAGIFETGRYNCISSAMLYVVLARAFDLPVRGVQVPTHAFVEMGAPGGKILEVETTSDTGFDHVHDERFYRESAARWSASRGLRPVTFEDYQHRKILEPYRFMAAGLKNQGGVAPNEMDRARLFELAALVDPDDPEAQELRAQSYADGSAGPLQAQRVAHDREALRRRRSRAHRRGRPLRQGRQGRPLRGLVAVVLRGGALRRGPGRRRGGSGRPGARRHRPVVEGRGRPEDERGGRPRRPDDDAP